MSPPDRPAHPNPWAAFRRSLLHFDRRQLNPWMGIRNAVAVAVPLCIGALLARPLPALIAATGALNVGFADGSDPHSQRIRRMFGAVCMVGAAVFCGSWLGGSLPSAVLTAAVWGFGAGMLMALGTQVGNVGVSSLCVLLIFSGQPMPPGKAALSGFIAMAGGILAAGISSLIRPLRGLEPERKALASLYLELARLPAIPVRTSRPPEASSKATTARQAIDALSNHHSLHTERLRALLDQAERIRICLLTLRGLRERACAGPGNAELAAVIDNFLAEAATALQATGQSLASDRPINPGLHPAAKADAVLTELRRQTAGPDGVAPVALAADIQAQMDALTRQLRVTFDLASHATPAGSVAFARREAAQPWRLRIGSALTNIRANLTLRSPVFRHAVRLSLCLAAGDALARALALVEGWRRPYWLPLTIAVVLKPDFSTTLSRGVLRLAGTFAGLLLATALFHMLPQTMPVEIALIATATFLLRWAGPANYGLLAVAVSALVVLLVAVSGVSPAGAIVARAENTVFGGAMALLAYWMWPTWERTQVNEAFASLFDAYRRHWELLGRAYAATGKEIEKLRVAMDRTRLEARLARTNTEASVDRLAAEPGTTREQMSRFNAMLSSSHIFAHSAIMLEANWLAGAASTGKTNGPLQEFFERASGTLSLLAAILRGGEMPANFPDLRETHRRLVESGEGARETLIGVETDKIVNSLNTLREQILAGRQS